MYMCIVSFLWMPNALFEIWAEIARVVSFLWLVVQGLLFLDIAHDIHGIYL